MLVESRGLSQSLFIAPLGQALQRAPPRLRAHARPRPLTQPATPAPPDARPWPQAPAPSSSFSGALTPVPAPILLVGYYGDRFWIALPPIPSNSQQPYRISARRLRRPGYLRAAREPVLYIALVLRKAWIVETAPVSRA